MLARILQTVEERRLLEPRDHVIVACSGGADSVSMTHALAQLGRGLGITLTVASVDHGLRAESRGEVALVARLAASLGLPFRPIAVDVGGEGSLQRRAREARYAALLALARETGARRIAVGHTMDDQAETVLGRMLRGAGLDGLAGIAPRRRDGVVRPLIDCRRDEVIRYLDAHALAHVIDPSNADRRFERVRIRLDVLPALRLEDPQLVPHLARLADDARAASRLVRAQARKLLARQGFPDHAPLADALRRAPEAVRHAALRRWVEVRTGRRARRAHVVSLARLIESGRGEVRLGGRLVGVLREGALIAVPAAAPTRSERR